MIFMCVQKTIIFCLINGRSSTPTTFVSTARRTFELLQVRSCIIRDVRPPRDSSKECLAPRLKILTTSLLVRSFSLNFTIKFLRAVGIPLSLVTIYRCRRIPTFTRCVWQIEIDDVVFAPVWRVLWVVRDL